MRFDQIRWVHVLTVLLVGLGLLILGALTQSRGTQEVGLLFVFFGAIVYLFIRRRPSTADGAGKDDDSK